MNGTLTDRLENLSPAKRLLLEMKLKEKIGAPKEAATISKRKNAAAAPLSSNQESLLFVEQLNPQTAAYNLYEAIRLTGNLDFGAVQKTLDAIAARHEALRTTFREIDGQPQQIVAAPQPIELPIADLRRLPQAERESEALKMLHDEINRPMNLRAGPLFGAAIIRLAADENIFLVKMHHIISDGWSMNVFWKDFAEFYRSFARGETPALPALPVQFGDYAIWSREQLKREEKRQTEYWKNHLKDAPALLELPTDRPRPAAQSYRGAQESIVVPAPLRDELKRFAQQEGVTVFMTLLSVFDVLLARYTGQKDFVVGSPIAGRSRTETENLIGFFVNTLALRADLSGDPTFRQLLRQVRHTTLEAFANQDLPFEKVVAAVQPERSLSYNPIYQAAFALQPASDARRELPNLKIEPINLELVTSKFDLFVSVKETSEGLTLGAEYSTDLFDAATVRRLLSHFQNLLDAVIADPSRRVSELSLLGETERRQLLFDWNETAAEYPNGCLHELFEAQAAARPHEIAVVAPDGDLTYGQLNEKANRIANYLRQKGVAPNEPVGILMDRSALMTAGILGILKAGGAYLPLDSGYPPARLRYMLENARVKTVLTIAGKVSLLPEIEAEVVRLDSDWEIVAAESAENLRSVNEPNDLAYIIYTSGSTGEPKGTLIPHRAVNRLVFNANYVQIGADDRIAHVSNVSFDAATFELWGALLHGARLVVLDKDLVLSPREFVAELIKHEISTMFLTTALFNLLAREHAGAFRTLKTLMFGGEATDAAAVRRVLENDPPERLLNVYGPTETTTFAAWHEIKTVAPDAQIIPIGRPISNTTIYLLDADRNPVPVGVPGEIYIGGDGLAHGYLNRPELTAEKFVTVALAESRNKSNAPNPDSAGGASQTVRLYRTGDLAKRLPNGDIEFIGRADNQIKLRGFRIELGEIESAVGAHPVIKEAVVAVKEHAGEKKIVAYYAAIDKISTENVFAGNASAETSAPTAAELREFLKQKLPEYMIPSLFIAVAGLSLNANGKIDRHKLPALADVLTEATPAAERDAPKDELEIKLTRVWRAVLGLPTVGVADNFFECGGHSLVAVRLFSEIEKALGVRLPLATLFQAPTIERLAALIRAENWQPTWNALVPLLPSGTKPPFFCIHAVGGNILEYNDLAKHLGADQPFYGLQALGLDGKSAPLENIEEMADAYLQEIREIQPVGPYYLGGRSFGGTVAYEIARRLVESGEKVALLAILDSYPKGWSKLCSDEEAKRYKKEFFRLRIKRHLENWQQLGIAGKTAYFLEKANYKKRKIKNLAWRLQQKLTGKTQNSVGATIRNVEEINYLAIKKYTPQVYAGAVTFFGAREEICPEENLTGWRMLAQGGVNVVEVPGDHQTMIKEPHVRELARALERSIEQSIGDKNDKKGIRYGRG